MSRGERGCEEAEGNFMLKLQLRIDSQQKSRTGTEAAQRNVAVIGKGKAALKSGGVRSSGVERLWKMCCQFLSWTHSFFLFVISD